MSRYIFPKSCTSRCTYRAAPVVTPPPRCVGTRTRKCAVQDLSVHRCRQSAMPTRFAYCLLFDKLISCQIIQHRCLRYTKQEGRVRRCSGLVCFVLACCTYRRRHYQAEKETTMELGPGITARHRTAGPLTSDPAEQNFVLLLFALVWKRW